MFGANRVSAATTEMLIEGNIAGKSAAAYAEKTILNTAEPSLLARMEKELLLPFGTQAGPSPVELRQQLHHATKSSLMVLRNGKALVQAADEVAALRDMLPCVSLASKDRRYNKEWMDYLQLRGGLLTAAAILKSAGLRKESRGVHVREDYPRTDDIHYLKNLTITNEALDTAWVPPVHTFYQPEPACRDYTLYTEEVIKKLS